MWMMIELLQIDTDVTVQSTDKTTNDKLIDIFHGLNDILNVSHLQAKRLVCAYYLYIKYICS